MKESDGGPAMLSRGEGPKSLWYVFHNTQVTRKTPSMFWGKDMASQKNVTRTDSFNICRVHLDKLEAVERVHRYFRSGLELFVWHPPYLPIKQLEGGHIWMYTRRPNAIERERLSTVLWHLLPVMMFIPRHYRRWVNVEQDRPEWLEKTSAEECFKNKSVVMDIIIVGRKSWPASRKPLDRSGHELCGLRLVGEEGSASRWDDHCGKSSHVRRRRKVSSATHPQRS